MVKLFYFGMVVFILPSFAQAADRFIIKYKPTTTQNVQLSQGGLQARSAMQEMARPLSSTKMMTLNNFASGANVKEINQIATGAHVLLLNKNLDETQTQNFIDNVKSQSDIQYIEEDKILKPVSITPPVILNPNWQWNMLFTGEYTNNPEWSGDNIYEAWLKLVEAGYGLGKNVVIGVVDTGYTPHPNILSALQPLTSPDIRGYQFISDCRISGQCPPSTPSSSAGNYSYSQDAIDLGDYVSSSDISNSNGFFASDCYNDTSSWHGTHVSGIIAANGYTPENPDYIAGGAPGAKIVPVRVLGKCGGYISDITNGVMWASGLEVINNGKSIPLNPNPAQIINLSLGGSGKCTNTEQDAFNAVARNGTLIVVAAGNDSGDISNYNPSSCNGVIVVAAKGPSNNLAYYSNYGATTITASGGDASVANCFTDSNNVVYCPSMIYSTVWSSPQAYKSPSQGGKAGFAFYSGTSMATPHVVAAIADMITVLKAKNINYTLYGISQVLQQTAKSYNNCSSSGCAGSGALDTAAAIKYVLENDSLPTAAPAPAPLVSGGGGGGGCSAISNGDDCSLILLLIGSAFYTYKRRRFKKY